MGYKSGNNQLKKWAKTLVNHDNSQPILTLQAQPLDSEIFPQEVVAATLANLFHFLVRNDHGQCDIAFYPVIQQLFSHYPRAQQKLVENILNTVSKRELESISLQLLSISELLDKQSKAWVIQQSLRIMFYRQWSDQQVRSTLKQLSTGLVLDSQHIQTIIENIQELY
ncbi:hypothetical protein F3J02_09965 [Acinetobacter sp. Tr-809]|uniref:hypothetical protein n=1 Tax=Acinetobacter sp. Tr-809 TaxID=2608324 RepID=UPI0014245E09|nr:hypothetical protein [Acinetobacter sp. Tr-809]NIE96800.1 hypothetical protein [Acinetobacter sp. Tr-809]